LGQRGAVIVEAALIMPVVLLLSMGVVDLGFLVDHNLTLASATTAGTRAGVRAGNSADADQQVL
jgi:Flp pilus assembly protein TadG